MRPPGLRDSQRVDPDQAAARRGDQLLQNLAAGGIHHPPAHRKAGERHHAWVHYATQGVRAGARSCTFALKMLCGTMWCLGGLIKRQGPLCSIFM